mmetsp:Transcript_133544/g.386569  ORF Transcript_133544/g.386569 Transcript_133544/m.386569 type:complete len:307 (-) Transcript_133544:274-1194(-)
MTMCEGAQYTVVLRNIACRLTPEMVKQILGDAGLEGTFSFVCVPCIPSGRSNLGYAFVGFRSSVHAEECRRLFQGKVFGGTSSKKICEVVPANEEKDARALMHMSRRQRKGRQLGLLVCDGSGEQLTSVERAPRELGEDRLETAVNRLTSEKSAPPPPAESAKAAAEAPAGVAPRGAPEGLAAPPWMAPLTPAELGMFSHLFASYLSILLAAAPVASPPPLGGDLIWAAAAASHAGGHLPPPLDAYPSPSQLQPPWIGRHVRPCWPGDATYAGAQPGGFGAHLEENDIGADFTHAQGLQWPIAFLS